MTEEKVFINSVDLRILVSEQLGPYCGTAFTLYVADGEYYCPPLSDVLTVMETARVDQGEYVAEAHDCDDFARLLVAAFIRDAYREGKRRPAYCFGLICTTGHAFNFFVDDSLAIRLVEPQTSKVSTISTLEDVVSFMLV